MHEGTDTRTGPPTGPPPKDIRQSSTPWWLNLGREEPLPEAGCTELGCSSEPIALYCATHETFLPQSGVQLSKTHWGLIVSAAVVAYALFWVSAESRTAVPLYLLFIVTAGVILRLTLRRFLLARSTIQFVWLVAAITIPILQATHGDARKWAVVTIMILTFALWVIHVNTETGTVRALDARIVVISCVTLLCAALAAAATAAGAVALWEVYGWRSEGLNALLRWIAGGAAAGVLLLPLVAALVRGTRLVDMGVDPILRTPSPPMPVRFGRPRLVNTYHRRGLAAQMSRAMTVFAFLMKRATIGLTESAANFARHLGHLLLAGAVAVLNTVWNGLISLARYLSAVARSWLHLIRQIARLVLVVGWRSSYITILPVVAAGAGAVQVLIASEATRDYLSGGGLADAARLVVSIALALAGVCLLWFAWSGLSVRQAAPASARNVRGLAISGLACQAVGGWLLGIPGTFGHGPIRVGYFTCAATLGFGAAIAWSHYFTGADPEGLIPRERP